MPSNDKQRTGDDYHVAWIRTISNLKLSACLMLDKKHPNPPYDTCYGVKTYICGSRNDDAIVITTYPPGSTCTVNTGCLTGSISKTFRNIHVAVLVRIGGRILASVVSEDTLEIGDGPVTVDRRASTTIAAGQADGVFEMGGTIYNPDWRLINTGNVFASDQKMSRVDV